MKQQENIDGSWVHRPRFKVYINRILVALQFWRKEIWMITSVFEVDPSGDSSKVKFLRYSFDKVRWKN